MRAPLVPLLALVALAAVAAVAVYFLAQPGGGPSYVVAGNVEDFTVGEPVHFADQSFYIVKQESGEFLALYQKDPHLGCTVPWRPDFEFHGQTGWFRNPCHRETYTLSGECVFGPCPRGLDRFPVEVVGDEVRVDTSPLICGPGAPAGMVCTP